MMLPTAPTTLPTAPTPGMLLIAPLILSTNPRTRSTCRSMKPTTLATVPRMPPQIVSHMPLNGRPKAAHLVSDEGQRLAPYLADVDSEPVEVAKDQRQYTAYRRWPLLSSSHDT